MMLANERVRRETALRDAVLAGDSAAWRTLYDGAYTPLWAYAIWRCAGLRDLAEEATQETWLVAVRRIGDFDPVRASFLAWLRGILAMTLRNRFRADSRPMMQSLNDRDVPAPHEDRDIAERIAQALSALPERQEAVLRAKYLGGQSVGTIAEEWGETSKAIESLLSRARQAFREQYEQDDAAVGGTQP